MSERLRVLVVDDDAPARRALASFLARRGYAVREAEDGQSALKILGFEELDVVLSDVRMPGLDGLALTRAVRQRSDDTVVVLMTAYASVDSVIAALREGAWDYLPKPIDPEQLAAALHRAEERLKLRRRVRSLTAALSAREALAGLIGNGPGMRALLETVRTTAHEDVPVLLTGEPGTCKELIAKAIHGLSRRAEASLVVWTSGTSDPPTEHGLFGAGIEKPGAVHQADGGTLVIDGLEKLSASEQNRLLRLLDSRICEASDGSKSGVDVRVVAVGGEKLEELVKQNQFNAELFYRLRGVELRIPPLRERREDIPAMVEGMLDLQKQSNGPRVRVSPEALSLMMAYEWPGNVRELEAVVRAAAAQVKGDELGKEHLPTNITKEAPKTTTLAQQVAAYERSVLRQALERVQGQVGRAAEVLGVPERTLRRKMRLFGLAKEAFRKPARTRRKPVLNS